MKIMHQKRVGFNGTSTQFMSLAPCLTRKSGTESPIVKESRRCINLANAILISRSPTTASPFNSNPFHVFLITQLNHSRNRPMEPTWLSASYSLTCDWQKTYRLKLTVNVRFSLGLDSLSLESKPDNLWTKQLTASVTQIALLHRSGN